MAVNSHPRTDPYEGNYRIRPLPRVLARNRSSGCGCSTLSGGRKLFVNIDIEDYNTRTGLLNILTGKGNKQRTTYLNTDSRIILKKWICLFFSFQLAGFKCYLNGH